MAPIQTNARNGRQSANRKIIAVTMLAGVAVGAAAGKLRKPAAVDGAAVQPPQPMIDWKRARSIAISMNRGLALTAAERTRATDDYRQLVEQCLPIVTEYTGIELPDAPERTFAVDRVDWIEANIDGFKRMFEPFEGLNPASDGAPSAAGVMFSTANRAVLSTEVGVLLGYMARKVLGQYDLALLGREPVDSGKLYYVEPNIRAVEQAMQLPKADFRMWLALHEVTHAFEFEGVPWLKPYFNGLIESYFAYLRQDAEQLRQGFSAMRTMVTRAREQRSSELSWIEAVMTPEQRTIFNQMQAAMCMVEGYSNHVMNAVGKDLLPKFDRISKTFERRQQERSPIDKLFVRLTGLDLKYEQYRLGEQFINKIADERGHDVAKRIWDNAASLPTMEEIRNPQLWLDRVVDAAAPNGRIVGAIQ